MEVNFLVLSLLHSVHLPAQSLLHLRFLRPLIPENLPPSFLTPQSVLHSFIGEDFVYQLEARDPEGSDVSFLLEAGPSEVSLSHSGLISLRVMTPGTMTFSFTITDECHAHSTHRLEVRHTDRKRDRQGESGRESDRQTDTTAATEKQIEKVK